MLSAAQLALAKLGATSGVDRFADTTLWSRLPTGEPRFHEAPAWLRGRVVLRVALSGSILYVVHVIDASVDSESASDPLAYHNRTWHRLGDHSALD
jgi:flavin reductase (DIM6/NTAB) family NADH-FMN oxidoreductase RutF